MTGHSSGSPSGKDLIQILVERKVISAAQGQLAVADQEVTGMSIDEVLLARGWVTQALLDEHAPWLKKAPEKLQTVRFAAESRTYEENLKEFKKLMEKILGTGWD